MKTIYQISNLALQDDTFTASITFNPSHPVFGGHFPGQPVVPGVVLFEIAAAATSQAAEKRFIVREVSIIKFLQLVDPTVNTVIMLEGSIIKEEPGKYSADLILRNGETIFSKIKGLKLDTLSDEQRI